MDLKFLAGDQWPAQIRLQREAANRPCLTINRLPQFVNQVANTVRQNPPAIKAIPAGGGASEEIAEIYSGLFRQIQYKSNATNIYAQASYYAVACGIGHFRLTSDYVDEDTFEQELRIKPIPYPLSVFWDPDAVQNTREDSDFCLVTEFVARKTFEKKYPNASPADFDAPQDLTVENGLFWSNRDAIRIAEYWKKVPLTRTIVRLQTGEQIDVTDVEREEVAKLSVIQTRKVKSHKIKQWLLSGEDVLDGGEEGTDWAGRYIPIFPIIGSEVALETKIYRHGLIRFARDPQQLYNFWRSAAAEAIALAPRSPFLVTPAMIAKFKGQWDTINTQSRPYMLFEPDPDIPNGRPQREPPADIPRALTEESSISSDEMKATTGIYDAALGARSNEISGVAIHARESQGDNSTLHYSDNMVATLHHLGRALVDLVPKVYDSQRVLHVLAEDSEDIQQPVSINMPAMSMDGVQMLLNDLNQGSYDVRVKVGPAYATQRAEAADSMLEFVKAVPQAYQVCADLIARNMDWPGASEVADRLKRMLPPNISGEPPEQQPPPSPEMQQQQAMQQQFTQGMAQAKLGIEQGKASKAQADAIKAHAEAQAAFVPQGQQAELSPQDVHELNQAQAQAPVKNALLQATLQERQARAVSAQLNVQGKQLDNAIKRAKFVAPDPYKFS